MDRLEKFNHKMQKQTFCLRRSFKQRVDAYRYSALDSMLSVAYFFIGSINHQ